MSCPLSRRARWHLGAPSSHVQGGPISVLLTFRGEAGPGHLPPNGIRTTRMLCDVQVYPIQPLHRSLASDIPTSAE